MTVELEPIQAQKLEELAKQLGITTSDMAKEAILRCLEDSEDYQLGMEVLKRGEPTIGLNELERELELEG